MGVIACEMATGRRPQLGEPPPELPVAVAAAIRKATAPEPGGRYAGPREFAEAFVEAQNVSRETGRLEMAHVLFLDLVGYSRLPMEDQSRNLAELQKIVRETSAFEYAERAGELLRLPSGDGMALIFFRNPEAPVECAVEIAQALKSRPHLKLRSGVHAGPVHRVADINANLNVAGGGINLAQRVMDAGDAGHILVSGAVAEVLSQSSRWSGSLADLGEHAVKHGVKVRLYNFVHEEAGNAVRPSKLKGGISRRVVVLTASAAAGVAAFAAVYGMIHKPPPPPPAPPELSMHYSLAVQRFVNRRPEGEARRVAGEITVEKGYGIALEAGSNQAGHLYVLNEGPAEAGMTTFNMLYPELAENASAALAGGQTVRLPRQEWWVFDDKAGTEKLYLVWSAEPVRMLEEVRAEKASAVNGVVVVRDATRLRLLAEFMQQHQVAAAHVTRDEEARRTTVRRQGGALAHVVRLEHY
ncbi:MAG: adenylate/guanylate cyclase domain-containing protein [Bryobacteraceae bacterium]